MSVLDYPTVQIRILPLLATTFALHYTGLAMRAVYQNARQDIDKGNFQSLAHMHSMSSGLKSLCTMLAADGIETCRRAMGGHGFGGGSGLIQLNNDYLSKPTVEGDNWMLTQQVAAYLIKKMTAAVNSVDNASTDETDARFKEFVRNKRSGSGKQAFDVLNSDLDIVKSFEQRATTMVCRRIIPILYQSLKLMINRHMRRTNKESSRNRTGTVSSSSFTNSAGVSHRRE
jgi:acyl-CoA oxidase